MTTVQWAALEKTELRKDIECLEKKGFSRDLICSSMHLDEIICAKDLSDEQLKTLMEKVALRGKKKRKNG